MISRRGPALHQYMSGVAVANRSALETREASSAAQYETECDRRERRYEMRNEHFALQLQQERDIANEHLKMASAAQDTYTKALLALLNSVDSVARSCGLQTDGAGVATSDAGKSVAELIAEGIKAKLVDAITVALAERDAIKSRVHQEGQVDAIIR